MPTTDQPPAVADHEHAGAHDWPAQAADTIVDVVGKARQKSTGPALTVVSGIVHGLLVAIAATMAMILLVVGLVRLANNWLDVWLTYLILGTVFVLTGLLMWRQRAPSVDEIEGIEAEAGPR
jgi:hypothetical protein